MCLHFLSRISKKVYIPKRILSSCFKNIRCVVVLRRHRLLLVTYAALQAQLLAMLSLQRHLGVLPFPTRLRSWESSLDISLGIAQVVGEWERVISTLKFPNGVPPEVWGTGFSPSKWRTQNPSDLNALRHSAYAAAAFPRP